MAPMNISISNSIFRDLPNWPLPVYLYILNKLKLQKQESHVNNGKWTTQVHIKWQTIEVNQYQFEGDQLFSPKMAPEKSW